MIYQKYIVNSERLSDSICIVFAYPSSLWESLKRLRGEGYDAVIKYDGIVTNKWDEVAREYVYSIKNLC